MKNAILAALLFGFPTLALADNNVQVVMLLRVRNVQTGKTYMRHASVVVKQGDNRHATDEALLAAIEKAGPSAQEIAVEAGK